jgi:predicted ATPase/DNA-binding SARP family transcriptional activator
MGQKLLVRALGRVELAADGRPLVELASAKATALLVYLAMTGTAQPRSTLAGLLWSDLPEATARANLRLVLTKLRRALPDLLHADRQAVALAPGHPVWVDALEVERLAAATSGAEAGELLAAVRLCRGDLLDGFELPGAALFDDWLVARRGACRSAMLALMDRAVRQARDAGDAATGVEVARRLIELEPLHEEAHRALMWFLAKGGQRGAALAQFETCRYVLREELAIEPSPATLALREEIGRGGGFAELDEPVDGRERPPGVASPHLPQPLTAMVGRQAELARLRELLDDPASRLVTLVGPGGIGKTRLALEAAAARRGSHRDGVTFVSFVGAELSEGQRDLVVASIAAALGVSLAVPRDPLELLADHLASRELLLVLDNLEQLRDAGEVLAELLRRAPGVQVLATSRRRLGLGAEWLVEVPGLPYPPAGAVDVASYEAVQLFEVRASLVRPGFRLAADADGVARLCRLLAGVPLAIELAAHWVRSATPSVIADRLAGGLDLLATSFPDVERRHRSLRGVIDWSWRLLTEQERLVLARLSVLRGGFDLDAAAAVAGATLPLLGALVDQSLVEAGEDGRYGMHELLRQYAAERLAADAADERATRERHAEHFAALLPDPDTASDPVGGGGAMDPLDAEVENLRAATDWLVANADPARLDAHLARLWPPYYRRGWFREARAILAAALARNQLPVLERARWHRLVGETHLQLGEAGAAREHFERALSLLGRRVPASLPGWLDVLATQALERQVGRLRPGGRLERRPERRARAAERAAVCWRLAEVYWVSEERVALLPVTLERAALLPVMLWGLNQAERSGRTDLAVIATAGWGMTLGTAGFHRTGHRLVRAAVDGAARCGDPVAVTWTQVVGGLYWLGVGDWAALDAGVDKAVRASTDAKLHRSADQVLLIGAICRYLTGRFEAAVAMAAEATAPSRERRDPVGHLWGLLIQAEARLRRDPGDAAVASLLDEAARLVPMGVARIDAARYEVAAARRHLAAGRTAEAWEAVRRADGLVGPDPSVTQYTLEAHAGVPDVCLALLAQGAAPVGPAELRATAASGLRRLRRYARSYPMARPRALTCLGAQLWLEGRRGAARRAWARAAREAERRAMPWELARAHQELGGQLAPGERSPLGLDRAAHLDRARSIFASLGCPVSDLDEVAEAAPGAVAR